MKNTIESAWTDIVSWEGWQKIGEFLNDTWKWVMDLVGLGSSNEGSTSASSRVESRYRAALKSVDTIIKSDVGMGSSEKDAQKAEEKVSIFQRIVDALTNFFTSISNAASEIAKSTMLKDFLKALGDFFAMLTHLMTEALKLATRIGTGQGSATDIAGVISLGLGYILTKIYDLMHTKHLAEISTNSQSFGLQFLEIAAGIALVSAAIIAISNVDTGKLLLASGVVLIIGGVIATVIGVLSKLTQAGTAKTLAANAAKMPETGLERIGKNLIDNLSKIAIVFLALKELPNIIQTIADVKKDLGNVDIGKDVMDTLIGLTTLLGGMSLVFAIVSKIGGVNISIGYQAATAMLVFFGELLLGFLGAGGILELIEKIGNIGDEDVAAWAVGKITILATIFNAIGGALGGFVDGLIHGGTAEVRAGTAAQVTETTLQSMSRFADIFDTEKISGILRISNLLNVLSDNMTVDPQKMADFGQSMQQFAGGLYDIAYYLNNEDTPFGSIWNGTNQELIDNIHGFEEFGSLLGRMLSTFAPFMETSSYKVHGFLSIVNQFEELAKEENLSRFSKSLKTIMERLGKDLPNDTEGIQFDGLAIATKLFDAIQIGLNDESLPKFNAVPVVDAIVKALVAGDTAIAAIVHSMVQAGLDKSGTGAEGEGYTVDKDATAQLMGLIAGNNESLTSILNDAEKEMIGEDGEGGFIGTLGDFEDQMNSILGKGGSLNLDFSGLSEMLLGDGENSMTGIFNSFKENLKGFGLVDDNGEISLDFVGIGKQIIGDEGVEGIQSIIKKVNGLIDEDGKFDFSGITKQLFGEDGKGGLFKIFEEFKVKLRELLKDSGLDDVVSFINKLNNFFTDDGKLNLNLDYVAEQLYGKDGKGGILGVITEFVDKIKKAVGEDTINAIEGAFKKLNALFDENGKLNLDLSNIEKQLFDEEGKPIGILEKLVGMITELQAILDEMKPLEVKITPVFSMDNLTADNLMAQLGLQSVNLPVGVDAGKLQVNFTGLQQELGMDAIKQKLDGIQSAVITYTNNNTAAVNNLGAHMDGIAAEVSRMKLYLDGRTLVGGIIDYVDAELYNRSVVSSRTGITVATSSVI